MFRSALIANRGEIACRVIRTARRMGLRTIAVYSEADAGAMHVAQADEAHLIGPPPAAQSYLLGDRILEAATASGAECIHPGYGFLSENAAFAEACAAAGIAFVGPPAAAIHLMGRKDDAKALMAKAGVPVVPGYDGSVQDAKALAIEAERIGYPVMIKAVAGGGGKGMRRVDETKSFAAALEGAQREGETAFGDGRVLLEKCIDRPRHIEVQVFADRSGNAVHLFERDCSLQRRHQKIIEEAPAPGMTEGLRARMGAAAVEAARAVGYVGAGTVEFLVDGGPLGDATGFYFLEMNTRLQVEHPVTEEVTGTDLVEWQFRVAAGETLPRTQDELRLQGHAVEARLYAEDPDRRFLPSAGPLHALRWPEGVRIDTGVRAGDAVTPFYDPMIAKIVAKGATRDAAMARLRAALAETVVAGPKTNLAFLHALLGDAGILAGEMDTALVDRGGGFSEVPGLDRTAVRLGAEALLRDRQAAIEARRERIANDAASPWSAADGFALGGTRGQRIVVEAGKETFEGVASWDGGGPHVRLDGDDGAPATANPHAAAIVPVDDGVIVVRNMRQTVVRLIQAGGGEAEAGAGSGVILAPMHGKITKIDVGVGQRVRKGDRLAVLEAMKMEHVLHAPFDGVVSELKTEEGAQIEEAAVVAVIAEGGGT
ncbi:MAG: ATP-grasp domain-containing protein [Hyphomicrobiales bacterium]|nr:ATP-grasp domain-containing protein [Hyphomicrobiales bacterium]